MRTNEHPRPGNNLDIVMVLLLYYRGKSVYCTGQPVEWSDTVLRTCGSERVESVRCVDIVLVGIRNPGTRTNRVASQELITQVKRKDT